LTKTPEFVRLAATALGHVQERLNNGSTQSKNIKGKDPPPAVHQYEAQPFQFGGMFRLRQQGFAAPSLSQMRFLPRKAGYCP
jgi:hypothetical protein